MGGIDGLRSPPPKPSPMKGEGRFYGPRLAEYLPLSAPVRGKVGMDGEEPRRVQRLSPELAASDPHRPLSDAPSRPWFNAWLRPICLMLSTTR